ncbi:MAG: hypothetical protein CMQ12_15315 [Gammaproteobacteria bacterium]|nr:hypothetical protein [Gammaproteobacteria bacterium]
MNSMIIKAIASTRAVSRLASLALVSLLASFQLLAQQSENEPALPAETEQAQTSVPLVLLYLDAPVAVFPGIDPDMPVPVVVADPEDDPGFGQRLEGIREYNLAVAEIELNGGVWDRQLIEELTALGSLQQQQGYHPDAIETFARAIHVNRIHTGLHGLEQIPAVEQLIESYMALGDWEQADVYNNYLFYVQQKAYGADDPRIIPVLDALAKWNIQAFNIGYGDPLGMRLSTAMILFNAAARMVGAHYGPSDGRYLGYMEDIANSAYLVAKHPELMVEVGRPENRSMQQLLRDKLHASGSALPAGFGAGESALLTIVRYYSEREDSVPELATALTNLGDWYLLFERRRSSSASYAQAWEILSASENGEDQLQQLFAQVIPLPTYADQAVNFSGVDLAIKTDSGERSFAFVDFVFDVTEYGTVRSIRMLTEQTNGNSTLLGRVRRQLRNSVFRPVIKDGLPLRTKGNHFRYRYWY